MCKLFKVKIHKISKIIFLLQKKSTVFKLKCSILLSLKIHLGITFNISFRIYYKYAIIQKFKSVKLDWQLKDMKSLCRGGIPDRYRMQVWRQLVRYQVRDMMSAKGQHYFRNLCNMLPDSPVSYWVIHSPQYWHPEYTMTIICMSDFLLPSISVMLLLFHEVSSEGSVPFRPAEKIRKFENRNFVHCFVSMCSSMY